MAHKEHIEHEKEHGDERKVYDYMNVRTKVSVVESRGVRECVTDREALLGCGKKRKKDWVGVVEGTRSWRILDTRGVLDGHRFCNVVIFCTRFLMT